MDMTNRRTELEATQAAYLQWAIQHHRKTKSARRPLAELSEVFVNCNVLEHGSMVDANGCREIVAMVDCKKAGAVVGLADSDGPIAAYVFCPEEIGRYSGYDRIPKPLPGMACKRFVRWEGLPGREFLAKRAAKYDVVVC